MRLTLPIILIFFCQALAASVVPERVVTPLLNIFSGSLKKDDLVKVPVTTYKAKNYTFSKNSSSTMLNVAQYNIFKAWAVPVMQMIPNEAFLERRHIDTFWKGTAFYIGSDLVLTNHHVLSKDRSNSTQCEGFQLTDNLTSKVFKCQRVVYCNQLHDICLIEMEPMVHGPKNCLFCEGTKTPVPSLKIKSKPAIDGNPLLTAIGNTMGFGIHVSQGKGAFLANDRLHFFAHVTTGNSGGPLLNEEGLVVGLIKEQGPVRVGSDIQQSSNRAVPSDLLIQIIRKALAFDPDTLEKFNAAVVQ